MALDSTLLEILRCPDTHHAVLEYDAGGQTLTCTECRRVFEVRDGIPVLLLEDALPPGDGAPDDGTDGTDGTGEAGRQ